MSKSNKLKSTRLSPGTYDVKLNGVKRLRDGIVMAELIGSRRPRASHKWERVTYGANAPRCLRCALVMEKYTPEPKKVTYSRGGSTVAVAHFKARQPPCL